MLGSVAAEILYDDISDLEPGSGRHGGHSSLAHLGCSTPPMLYVLLVLFSIFFRFPVLLFELDPRKTNWTGLFGH